jgi:sporulation protein YlmC with PRC-barrel domain
MTRPPNDIRHDLVLRILDHQILGPHGELLGNVDDIELVGNLPHLTVTGLMVGPAALSNRLPGKLGTWTYAVWRRLHPDRDPTPTVVPVTSVTGIGPAISIDARAAVALAGTFGLELWLRRYVISRIPGATAGNQQDPDLIDSAAGRPERERAAALLAPHPHGRALSSLLGQPVKDAHGTTLGVLCELRCSGQPANQRQTTLTVTHLQVTPHPAGSQLGYGADPHQGPAPLAALTHWWQRHDLLLDINDIDRNADAANHIQLKASARPTHPHRA